METDGQYTVSVDGTPYILTGILQKESIKVRIGETTYAFADYFITDVSEPGKQEYRITKYWIDPNSIEWVEGTFRMSNVFVSGRMLFAPDTVPDVLKGLTDSVTVGGQLYYYADIDDMPYDGLQECTGGNGKRSEGYTGTPSGLDLYIDEIGLDYIISKGKLVIEKCIRDELGGPITNYFNKSVFSFTVKDASGKVLTFNDGIYAADGSGCAEVYVMNGIPKTLYGLPAGVYTVTEIPKAGYGLLSVNGKNAGGYTVGYATVEKTDTDVPVVKFVNTKIATGAAVSMKKTSVGIDYGEYPTPTISIVNCLGKTVWTGELPANGDTYFLSKILLPGTYSITEEVDDVNGYVIYDQQLLINGVPADQYMTFTVGLCPTNLDLEIVNTYRETFDMLVVKQWDDAGFETKRPETIELEIKSSEGYSIYVDLNGEDAVSEDGLVMWYIVVEKLLKYDDDGNEIIYQLVEPEVPEGYVSELMDLGEQQYVQAVRNTYVPKPGYLTITKTFELNGAAGLDEIKFTVTPEEGDAIDVVLTAAEGWTKTLELPIGTYTVAEDLESAGITAFDLTAKMDPEDGVVKIGEAEKVKVTVTDTYVRTTTSLKITKIWSDETNEEFRPDEVVFKVLADGKPTDIEYVLEGGDTSLSFKWEGEIKGLYKYHEDDGKAFVYTVEEVVPDRYEASYEYKDGEAIVTNKFIPTVDVTVVIKWDDDGKDRPDSVEVQLYADGEPYGDPVTITAEDNWTYTCERLDIDKEWSVDEPNVPKGYTKTVDNEGNTWTITNSKVPATGDTSNVMLWVILAGVSVMGLAALLFGRKLFQK
ncbi:MAG: Cna B-type domain-containing protein [Lachnospiraceae bacterium]|nr:Cna B-type domain-containing protein [Lachnospiraceae bacterium]